MSEPAVESTDQRVNVALFCNMGYFTVLLDNLSRSEKGADLTAREVAARIEGALAAEFGLEMSGDVQVTPDED